MVGEVRMINNEDTMPTTTEEAIPIAEVFFQNRRNRIAGRLAEAAIAKAHPTRKETFIPLNAIPRAMANTPTAKAESFPALTFALSVRFFFKYTSMKSWAIAP